MTNVPERLAALAKIYENRRAIYGKTDKSFGRVMKGLFPEPLTIKTEEDWNRLALLMHVVDKIGRYSNSFARGGSHADSLDDISVYAQMLAEADDERSGK